jgi:hypothetical protein
MKKLYSGVFTFLALMLFSCGSAIIRIADYHEAVESNSSFDVRLAIYPGLY